MSHDYNQLKRQEVLDYIESWMDEKSGWRRVQSGDQEIHEYQHKADGHVQMYTTGIDGELLKGSIYAGDDNIATFTTENTHHKYLENIEPSTESVNQELETSRLKEIQIPHNYKFNELDQMLESIDETFSGPDYNLSEIAK